MPYRHQIRVRYGDCDMQKVVFNANYLAYIDDAVDTWFRLVFGEIEEAGFDFMLKKATIEWHGPARFGDLLDLDAAVARWGRTSFHVAVGGRVDERPVFDASLVYVSTLPGAPRPVPVPDVVRRGLEGPAEREGR